MSYLVYLELVDVSIYVKDTELLIYASSYGFCVSFFKKSLQFCLITWMWFPITTKPYIHVTKNLQFWFMEYIKNRIR